MNNALIWHGIVVALIYMCIYFAFAGTPLTVGSVAAFWLLTNIISIVRVHIVFNMNKKSGRTR